MYHHRRHETSCQVFDTDSLVGVRRDGDHVVIVAWDGVRLCYDTRERLGVLETALGGEVVHDSVTGDGDCAVGGLVVLCFQLFQGGRVG